MDFAFLESMSPLMLYMFIISTTKMSIRTALHFLWMHICACYPVPWITHSNWTTTGTLLSF